MSSKKEATLNIKKIYKVLSGDLSISSLTGENLLIYAEIIKKLHNSKGGILDVFLPRLIFYMSENKEARERILSITDEELKKIPFKVIKIWKDHLELLPNEIKSGLKDRLIVETEVNGIKKKNNRENGKDQDDDNVKKDANVAQNEDIDKREKLIQMLIEEMMQEGILKHIAGDKS